MDSTQITENLLIRTIKDFTKLTHHCWCVCVCVFFFTNTRSLKFVSWIEGAQTLWLVMLTTFCQFIYIWHLHLFSWWTTRLPLYNCFGMNFLVLFIFSHKVWGSTNKYYCAAVGSTDHLCDWIWIVFVLDLVPQPISYFACLGRYRNWESDACCATYYLKSNHVWGELWYGA